MSLKDTENKAAACEKESKSLQDKAPFLGMETLRNMLDNTRKRSHKTKEKFPPIMPRKEFERK